MKDPNGRAYNRTAHLPARREMMQRWADYLDKLRIGARGDSVQIGVMRAFNERESGADRSNSIRTLLY